MKRKSKKFQKSKKLKHSKKVPKNGLTEPALWRVYVYLISSTSIQKENPFWNSIRQIKIRCAKYKFAERSHNFLMQLPMQLIFLVSVETLTSIRFVPKENPFWNSIPCQRKSKKCKKLKHSKKVPKIGLTEPPFGAYIFIRLVRHQC